MWNVTLSFTASHHKGRGSRNQPQYENVTRPFLISREQVPHYS